MCKTLKSIENQRKIPVESSVEIVHKEEEKLKSYPQVLKRESEPPKTDLFINNPSTEIPPVIVD